MDWLSLLWDNGQGLIRHALTTAGGFVTAQGLATSDQTNAAIGAGMVLIGYALSVFDKWLKQKQQVTK